MLTLLQFAGAAALLDTQPSTWQQTGYWNIKRNSFPWREQALPYAPALCLLAGLAQEQSTGGRYPDGRG